MELYLKFCYLRPIDLTQITKQELNNIVYSHLIFLYDASKKWYLKSQQRNDHNTFNTVLTH